MLLCTGPAEEASATPNPPHAPHFQVHAHITIKSPTILDSLSWHWEQSQALSRSTEAPRPLLGLPSSPRGSA